ncbi:hypothetical protein JW960_04100 [candidate division KSB1 bacterium]|nr:hypothetical protein [candidate division KSB1 bacterium]
MLITPAWEAIAIIQDVKGLIVVGGYSGIAQEQITALKEKNSNIQVQAFTYRL